MKLHDNQDLVFYYLDKNYKLDGCRFFSRDNANEYGQKIIFQLENVFDLDIDFCEDLLKLWAFKNGMPKDETAWIVSYIGEKLRINVSDEILSTQHGFFTNYVESDFINITSKSIVEEIGSSTLLRIVQHNKIKDVHDFLSVVKCIGYELGPLVYNPANFQPFRNFFSMNYRDILHERENNIYWQNWIRTRECYPQA